MTIWPDGIRELNKSDVDRLFMKKRYFFCQETEIQEHEFLIREVGGKSVGATRLNGRICILLNYCPHAGAQICKGSVVSALLIGPDQSVNLDCSRPLVRCPWHGWEFDLDSGRTVFESKMRLAFLTYELEEGEVFVWMR